MTKTGAKILQLIELATFNSIMSDLLQELLCLQFFYINTDKSIEPLSILENQVQRKSILLLEIWFLNLFQNDLLRHLVEET